MGRSIRKVTAIKEKSVASSPSGRFISCTAKRSAFSSPAACAAGLKDASGYNWDATWYQGPDHWPDAWSSGCQKSWRHLATWPLSMCSEARFRCSEGLWQCPWNSKASSSSLRIQHQVSSGNGRPMDWYFPVSAQTTAWWKLLNIRRTSSSLPRNITQNSNRGQTSRRDYSKPSFRQPAILKLNSRFHWFIKAVLRYHYFGTAFLADKALWGAAQVLKRARWRRSACKDHGRNGQRATITTKATYMPAF